MDRRYIFNSQRFWTNLFLIIWVVLALITAGCGDQASDQGSADQLAPASSESGSATFSIQWRTGSTDRSVAGSLERMAIADCNSVGVASITCDVYDDSNNLIATGGPWSCDAHGGRIENISAGPNRIFAAFGWDAANGSGNIVYRGQTPGVTISPGVITDTGTIDAYEFFPTDLTAYGVSNSQIDLSWAISAQIAGTIAGYNIYRAGSLLDTASSTSYSDTSGLSSATQYCYAVSAVDIYGNESMQTLEVCASTNDNNGPTAAITSPADNTTIDQNTYVTFTGTGTDPEDGDLSGNALVWTSSIDGQIGTGNSFATNALSAGVHTIQLTATDSEGADGSASITLTVNDNESPTVPGGVTATARSISQIEVGWTASTDNVGVVGYRVYLSGQTLLGQVQASPFVHDGLNPSTTYCYTVSAVDAAGNASAQSIQGCATTNNNLAPTASITAPANNANIDQNTSITFTGTGTDPEDGNLTGNALVWTSSIDGQIGTGNTVVTSALSAGVHTITLTATDSYNAHGSASITLTVNDTESPTVPGNVTATAQSSSQIQVSWTASSDNVGVAGYRVYDSSQTMIWEGNALSYVQTGLNPLTQYCYTVSAFDAAGNESAQSGPACDTTTRNINSILFLNFYVDIADQNSVDGYFQLAAFLRLQGFTVTQQYAKSITPSVISPYGIIVFGGDLNRVITQSEADAIRRFVDGGGRLLLLGDQGIETWSATLRYDLHLVTDYNGTGSWGIGFDQSMLCDDVDYCTYCASKSDPDGGVDYPFIRPNIAHQSTSGVQQFVYNWGQPLLVNSKIATIVAASSIDSWADINSVYISSIDEYYCVFDLRYETRSARAAMAVVEPGQGKVVAIGDNGMWFNYFFNLKVTGTIELAKSVFTYLSQ